MRPTSLLLVLLPAASHGFATPHAVPRRTPALRSHPAALTVANESSERFWQPWRLHDAFNLGVLPVATAWTGAALWNVGWNAPLARFFAAYIAIDAAWIALQPDIVGAPRVLIWHHLVTLLLCWHTLTYADHEPLASIRQRAFAVHPHPPLSLSTSGPPPHASRWVPHQHFVSWMTVVEFNTFFLILRRHVSNALIDLAFNLSWVAIRVVWVPLPRPPITSRDLPSISRLSPGGSPFESSGSRSSPSISPSSSKAGRPAGRSAPSPPPLPATHLLRPRLAGWLAGAHPRPRPRPHPGHRAPCARGHVHQLARAAAAPLDGRRSQEEEGRRGGRCGRGRRRREGGLSLRRMHIPGTGSEMHAPRRRPSSGA